MDPVRIGLLLVAAALAGCAAGRPVDRLPPTPLAPPAAVLAEARVRADADRSPAPPGAPSPFVADPEVRVLYRSAWSEPQAADPAPPPPDAAAPMSNGAEPPPAAPAPCATRQRRPFVPVGTVIGAGIGGALSTRSRRGEGALLGAGIGLLFDLQRYAR